MTPELRERAACAVLGLQSHINPMTADWADLWGRQYSPHEHELAPFAMDDACYGVYFGTGEDPICDFVAGKIVPLGTEPLPGTVVREMPAALEAVFECTLQTIGQTWQAISGEWMPTSGYTHAEDVNYCYERFAPGSHEGTVPVTIHLPVRKA